MTDTTLPTAVRARNNDRPMPHPAGVILREARTELVKSLRTPEYAVPTFVFPILFFGLFGLALSSGAGATRYMVATYGVFAMLGPALFGFGTSVAFEREQGLLALKRIAPLPALTYPLAKLATAAAMGFTSLLGVYLLAVLAGGVRLTAGEWGAMVAVHLLAVPPFALMGLVIGHSLRSQGAMAVTNVLFFILCIFGGLWMPIHILPDWIGVIGTILPSYHLAELALIAVGIDRPGSIGLHLAVIGLWCGVLTVLAAIALRRAET
ncbi:MAG: hypothetical protein RLY86_1784 [Pseudomonadota bacterium]|jgi:ABC-2 type transport system permease protein